MLYLSRLTLNPISRQVRADLADCHRMHLRVMSGFPDVEEAAPRQSLGVLYRVEAGDAGATLLVQSGCEPDWGALPDRYVGHDWYDSRSGAATKRLDPMLSALEVGQSLRFRLRANPTRRIDTKSGPDGARRHGRRVPLRTSESQMAWLDRKLGDAGAELVKASSSALDALATDPQVAHGQRREVGGEVRRLTLEGVLFEGHLRITDAARLVEATARGIGPGKSYGFGLLSLAPR